MGDNFSLSFTCNSIASTLKAAGRAAEAIPFISEALSSMIERGIGGHDLWIALLQLARMYRGMRRWSEALSLYQRTLDAARYLDYQRGISMSERGIGLCYEGLANLRSAEKHMLEAVTISTQLEDRYLPQLYADLQRIRDKLTGRI